MTGKMNTNPTHSLPRLECPFTFGTIYPTVDCIVVLKNKAISPLSGDIIKTDEPDLAHSP